MKKTYLPFTIVALSMLGLAACNNAGTNGGSTSSYSYSTASSAMMQASSAMMEQSSAMMEASSSSAMMQNSSAMMMDSSMSSEPLAADNATAVLAVQNFYIGAMHQSDPVASGFVASSRYLTDTARTALQAGGNGTIYCADKKPSGFTLVALGASQTQRTVVVTESFHDTPTVDITVSVVHQADGWKIDGVTCGASSAASSQ